MRYRYTVFKRAQLSSAGTLEPHQIRLAVRLRGEEPGEEQVGGVRNAVDGLIRCITQGADGVRLRHGLGAALEARCLPPHVHRHLPQVSRNAGAFTQLQYA